MAETVNLDARIAELLRTHGITPTSQRVSVASVLMARNVHLSALDVVDQVSILDSGVSRATVYNTLARLVDAGLIRELNVGSNRVFYDSNISPHHHFYNVESGELIDIDSNAIEIKGMPELPDGLELESIQLTVRIKATA